MTTAFEQAEPVCRYPLRGLVALAGISGRSSALEYNIDAFRKIMEVNVTGTFLCAQAAARMMRKNHVGGSIVLFASISGTVVNQVRLLHAKRLPIFSVSSRFLHWQSR